jgi:hypothetical protein
VSCGSRFAILADGGLDVYFNWATLAIAMAGLVAAVFAAWYAQRALLPPRRRLELTLNNVVQIVSPPDEQLEVRYEGELVASPHTCTLIVTSTGLHSVSSAQFDQGEPIVVELGVPIVAKR